MKKSMKRLALILASITIAGSLAGCGPKGSNGGTKDYSDMSFIVGAYRDLRTDPYNNSYSVGADKFMEEYSGSDVQFVIHKNNEDLVAAIASNDVWDVQLSIMSPTYSVFKQDVFEPLDEYIDMKNPVYTPKLMEDVGKYNGNIYGLSNVIMSDVLYCSYNEDMFNNYGIKTPHEYNEEGNWNWDNFIKMTDDLKKNQIQPTIQWTRPFLNRRYSLEWNDDYTVSTRYASQDQRDWLNFVRTLVYDKGIINTKGQPSVAKQEHSFVLQIMPHMLVADTGASPIDTIRYIPWVSKDGKADETYVVDYHFCVPKGAKSIDGSVELSNYMIEGCIDDRTKMYKDGMTEEDYEMFIKSLDKFYTATYVDGYGYSEVDLINEFSQGKAVSQHIAEIEGSLEAAVDAHNKKVEDKKNGVTEAPAAE